LSRLSLVAQQLLVPSSWKAQYGGQDGNQIANVLKNESLPLQEESVQILFRQAAFQIGSLRLSNDHLDFMGL